MDSLPDLSGQPAWVIVVVTGLTAIGTIAGAILQRSEKRSRRKRERRELEHADKPAIEQPHGVPSGPAGQADVLGASVNAIIEHARRESQEAADARNEARAARDETRALRTRYEQAMADRDAALRRAERALADLSACQTNVKQLRAQLDGTP